VQQRGAQRLGVEPHAGADLGHADRMDDELLAGPPALVRVVLAGERKCLHDAGFVDRLGDLVGVLLDDREQVGEQRALDAREVLGYFGCEIAVRVVGPVDGTVAGDRDGRVVGLGRGAGDPRLVLLSRGQAACRVVSLVRYRSPSSSL
jgi:hypothetical protein